MTLQPEMRCVEFVDSVTEWTEGALTDDVRLALEEHLAICPYCTRYLSQLRLTSDVLQRSEGAGGDDQVPSPSLREALLQTFREQHGS